MTTLSQRIADHVVGVRYEDLPPEAVEGAKRSLLDAIGVSLGASGLEPACAPFIDFALSAGGAPQATILGVGKKAPASLAAFANGALAHALDFEDAFDAAPMHPNAALVPAVLALAEARGGVSGKDFLTAIAVGCDLVCRLALSARGEGGWYPPPIFGAYGAIAGAGRILKLDAAQMLDAFSLGLNQVVCSGEIKNNPQSVLRAVRDAFPAQAAVVSADLAQRGVTGFAQPFEGQYGFFSLFTDGEYDEAELFRDLGKRFYGAEVGFKPWPACRGTHGFIEMALDLLKAGVAPSDIERIELRGVALHQMLMNPIEGKRAPTTAIDAKFSLPFVVAAAFTRGRVQLEDFAPAALADVEVRALARRVSHEVAPIGGAAGGELTVALTNGRRETRQVEDALGSLSRPISWAALVEKAELCARHAKRPSGEGVIRGLAAVISALEGQKDAAAALVRPLQ